MEHDDAISETRVISKRVGKHSAPESIRVIVLPGLFH